MPTVDYTALFEASPNPYMVLDPEYRFLGANEAYLRVTGRTRDGLIGTLLFESFPDDPNDPEAVNQSLLRASLDRVRATRRRDVIPLIRYAIPVRGTDGDGFEERFWSATHTPLLGADGNVEAILQHTEDVTELHRLRLATDDGAADSATREGGDVAGMRPQIGASVLRRAQEVQTANLMLDDERRRLRQFFEQAPGFMAVLMGPTHVFAMANAAYLDIVGRTDIVGQTVLEALPEIGSQQFMGLLDAVYATGTPFIGKGISVRLARQAGEPLEERFIDFIYQPISASDGTTMGIFVQGSDVTDMVVAQKHLADLNATLEERVAERTSQLELRNRELQEFAYVASHDLQEPLRKIRTFADLLDQEADPLGDEARSYLDRMRSAAARMSRLIHDLLAYSRTSTAAASAVPVDLNTVLHEVETDLQMALDQTGGRIEHSPLPTVVGEPVQMHQVLLNLVGNALKFARPGVPPVVKVGGRIEQTADAPAVAVVEVQDNGIGFEAKYRERIFQPFQRLHGRTVYDGTGIGLAIVRRVAERHGGTVEAHSVPGEGTTFVVRLPVVPSALGVRD